MELQQQVSRFYQYLEAEKQYSVHTLKNYQRDITSFLDYCQQQSIADFNTLDAGHIRQFVAGRHRQGLGGRSIQRLLSALRSLFHYLNKQHLLTDNPASGVRAPKAGRKLPELLTVDQLDQLLLMPDDDILSVRDKAMMELMYACGLRLSELVSLELDQIDQQQQLLNVTGKGNKQRHIPFGKKARAALNDWLKQRQILADSDEKAVFVSQRGSRLKHSSVQQRLKKWAIQQGLDTDLYPHKLRHSFASHILESSGDIRAVQELLGHENLSTTQIYTHLDFQHLTKIYDDAHPRARKSKK
ncbi:MAG: tyrosine recombinase XerC [Gammaproteobacteria bacterium]|nr:tyrosine recombinase XerC [Gammaproteobacteria bacterium]